MIEFRKTADGFYGSLAAYDAPVRSDRGEACGGSDGDRFPRDWSRHRECGGAFR